VTWLSEDGNRFHVRSKQLQDGSASVIIRVLNPKKGWTANLADSGELNREHSPGISLSDFSRLASRGFPQFFELFNRCRRKPRRGEGRSSDAKLRHAGNGRPLNYESQPNDSGAMRE
jgi:hypothetical protein